MNWHLVGRHRLRFGLRAIALGLLGLSCALAGIHYVVRRQQQLYRQQEQLDRDKVAEAMQYALLDLKFYDLRKGRLPAPVQFCRDGRPMCSWRVGLASTNLTRGSLLPDGTPIGNRFPWNHPWFPYDSHDPRFGTYYCAGNRLGKGADPLQTTILAVVGKGTAFGQAASHSLRDLDGDTILLIEVSNSGVHWLEPGDLPLKEVSGLLRKESGRRIGGVFADGFHVGFADGQVWYLRRDVPFEAIREFLTVERAGRKQRDELLAPYALAKYTEQLDADW